MRSLWMVAVAGCAAGRSEPRPITWSAPIELAAGGGQRGPWQQNDSAYDYVDDPSVALDASGAAVVVWVDQRDKDVLFQAFDRDHRPRFPHPVNVSRTPAVFSWLPRVVVSPIDPDDVFVLWQEIVFSGGTHGGEIFFARSLDRGATFDPPVNLSRSRNGDGKGRIDRKVWHNGSLDLAIGADGTLHAAWTEYDGPLWSSRSDDRGQTFTAPLLVDPGTTTPARAPALAVDGDTVHLAWTVGEDPGADVRLARSLDRGARFADARIVERTAGYSDAPKLAIDPTGTLHLVHDELTGDRHAVRYLRSRDGGATFEAAHTLARDAGFPALAVDGRDVVVGWERADGDAWRGIGLALSRDGGETFTAPSEIRGSRDRGANGSHQGQLMRKLAVRDGTLAVVNAALEHGRRSRVWLLLGRVTPR
jgi:hypothetical protein